MRTAEYTSSAKEDVLLLLSKPDQPKHRCRNLHKTAKDPGFCQVLIPLEAFFAVVVHIALRGLEARLFPGPLDLPARKKPTNDP